MFNSQNKIIILKQQLCIAGKKIIQMASKNERNDPTKLPQDRHPLKNLIAGGLGGLCATLFGHPLDTIKVRMQVNPREYRGAWDAIRTIIQREGPIALYKGVIPPLIGIVPIFAIGFFNFGVGKKLVQTTDQQNNKDLTPYQLVLAGMFSGLTTTPISVPTERIKCLLQMQKGNRQKYDGFMDCAVKLYRTAGIKNLYVGTCATFLRDIPAHGVYFGTYDIIKRHITSNSTTETTIWEPICCGGLAGMMHWIIAMPADVLKSRLQISTTNKYPNGMRSLLPLILQQEGFFILYRGIIPIMLRAFPANAACFLGYEITTKFIDHYIPWF